MIIPRAKQATTFTTSVPHGKLWLWSVLIHLLNEKRTTLPRPTNTIRIDFITLSIQVVVTFKINNFIAKEGLANLHEGNLILLLRKNFILPPNLAKVAATHLLRGMVDSR